MIDRSQGGFWATAVVVLAYGAAMGLLFTPINNAAFGSLKPSEAQQASGLINLSRQLGGSFGIAVISTYLTRHIQYHRVDLANAGCAIMPASNPYYAAAGRAASLPQHGRSTTMAAPTVLTGVLPHPRMLG